MPHVIYRYSHAISLHTVSRSFILFARSLTPSLAHSLASSPTFSHTYLSCLLSPRLFDAWLWSRLERLKEADICVYTCQTCSSNDVFSPRTLNHSQKVLRALYLEITAWTWNFHCVGCGRVKIILVLKELNALYWVFDFPFNSTVVMYVRGLYCGRLVWFAPLNYIYYMPGASYSVLCKCSYRDFFWISAERQLTAIQWWPWTFGMWQKRCIIQKAFERTRRVLCAWWKLT